MPSKFESVSDNLLPVIRLEVSNELRRKYKMKERDIAERLGITQAAVSKYLSGKSKTIANKARQLRERIEANREALHAYAESLSRGDNAAGAFCELCQSFGGFSCALASARAQARAMRH
ncbi:MAG: transcriptional regulator [Candidatus Micrarchaeia archaeon]